MIKISHEVAQIIEGDEVALYALSTGILNLSSYAKTIRAEVAKRTKKPVKLTSIVVALSRYVRVIKKQKLLLPKVEATSISVKSGLVEFTFHKNRGNRNLLIKLHATPKFAEVDFYTVTQGVNEISVIVPQALAELVRNTFRQEKPEISLTHLAALTVSFDASYIMMPNTTYAFTRVLAIHRINIVEIVSTFTELTFILEEKDLHRAFAYMSEMFHSGDYR